MSVAFLLGSGISIDAGMPSVETLGEGIFDGSGVGRHSSGAFATWPGGSLDFDAGAEVAAFVRRLRDLSVEYFDRYPGAASPSYEDVANAAMQVHDAISGEYESATVLPLLRELEPAYGGRERLGNLAGRACEYIVDLVCEAVGAEPTRLDHLRAILDGCEALGEVELYDLNHDRVLESALEGRALDFADGFGSEDGDLAFWEDRFDRPLRLYKLHGSVRWFRHQRPGQSFASTARCLNGDPDHALDGGGNSFGLAVDSRPQILTGTFGKALRYEGAPFRDLHLRMQNGLRLRQITVIIGYGFRDKTINSRLIHWMLESPDHRLVVVHPNLGELRGRARGAIAREWERWEMEQRVSTVEKPIEDTRWPVDLAPSLTPGAD